MGYGLWMLMLMEFIDYCLVRTDGDKGRRQHVGSTECERGERKQNVG